MSFSFNPGQAGQAPQTGGSEAPPLVVPTMPSIGVTSSAPKEVVSPFAYKNRSKSKFSVYFQLVVFLVFGTMLVIMVYLFSYRMVLISSIEAKKTELQEKQAGFPDLDLEKMVLLSDRLKIVNRVMNEHASVNTAFKILEASVLNPVTYTKFSLSKNKTKNGYSLDFAGQTTNYTALYQQTEAFNNKTFSPFFSKLSISGLGTLDKKGIGTFKVTATVPIEGINSDTFTVKPKPVEDLPKDANSQGKTVDDASSTPQTTP